MAFLGRREQGVSPRQFLEHTAKQKVHISSLIDSAYEFRSSLAFAFSEMNLTMLEECTQPSD